VGGGSVAKKGAGESNWASYLELNTPTDEEKRKEKKRRSKKRGKGTRERPGKALFAGRVGRMGHTREGVAFPHHGEGKKKKKPCQRATRDQSEGPLGNPIRAGKKKKKKNRKMAKNATGNDKREIQFM